MGLSHDANSVDSVAFKALLVKIYQGRANNLSKGEQTASKCLVGFEAKMFMLCREELSPVDFAFSKFRAQRNNFDTYLIT